MCAQMLAEAGAVAGEKQRRSEEIGEWERRDAPRECAGDERRKAMNALEEYVIVQEVEEYDCGHLCVEYESASHL